MTTQAPASPKPMVLSKKGVLHAAACVALCKKLGLSDPRQTLLKIQDGTLEVKWEIVSGFSVMPAGRDAGINNRIPRAQPAQGNFLQSEAQRRKMANALGVLVTNVDHEAQSVTLQAQPMQVGRPSGVSLGGNVTEADARKILKQRCDDDLRIQSDAQRRMMEQMALAANRAMVQQDPMFRAAEQDLGQWRQAQIDAAKGVSFGDWASANAHISPNTALKELLDKAGLDQFARDYADTQQTPPVGRIVWPDGTMNAVKGDAYALARHAILNHPQQITPPSPR